jgi:hypothetical protein
LYKESGMCDRDDIRKVKEAHEDELMARIPGAVAVAIGQDETTGEQTITVLVDEVTEEIRALVPTKLEGFQVRYRAIGRIQIQSHCQKLP